MLIADEIYIILANFNHFLQRHLYKAAKKAVGKMPLITVKSSDFVSYCFFIWIWIENSVLIIIIIFALLMLLLISRNYYLSLEWKEY